MSRAVNVHALTDAEVVIVAKLLAELLGVAQHSRVFALRIAAQDVAVAEAFLREWRKIEANQ